MNKSRATRARAPWPTRARDGRFFCADTSSRLPIGRLGCVRACESRCEGNSKVTTKHPAFGRTGRTSKSRKRSQHFRTPQAGRLRLARSLAPRGRSPPAQRIYAPRRRPSSSFLFSTLAVCCAASAGLFIPLSRSVYTPGNPSLNAAASAPRIRYCHAASGGNHVHHVTSFAIDKPVVSRGMRPRSLHAQNHQQQDRRILG